MRSAAGLYSITLPKLSKVITASSAAPRMAPVRASLSSSALRWLYRLSEAQFSACARRSVSWALVVAGRVSPIEWSSRSAKSVHSLSAASGRRSSPYSRATPSSSAISPCSRLSSRMCACTSRVSGVSCSVRSQVMRSPPVIGTQLTMMRRPSGPVEPARARPISAAGGRSDGRRRAVSQRPLASCSSADRMRPSGSISAAACNSMFSGSRACRLSTASLLCATSLIRPVAMLRVSARLIRSSSCKVSSACSCAVYSAFPAAPTPNTSANSSVIRCSSRRGRGKGSCIAQLSSR